MGLLRLKSRHGQAPFILENHFLAFPSFQKLLAFLGSFPSSSTPAVQHLQISLLSILCFCHISFYPSLSPASHFAYKDPFLLHWAHPNNNREEYIKIFSLITSSKSLLPHTVSNSQVLGIRIWTSLGGRHSTTIPKLIESLNTTQLLFNLTD